MLPQHLEPSAGTDQHARMHPHLQAIARAQAGVFLRRQALDVGYTPEHVDRALTSKQWRRVRRGAYAEASLWDRLDAVGQHRLRTHAVIAAMATPGVVSGVSAAVLHGLSLWQPALELVDVTHPGVSSRIEGGVHHRNAELPGEDIVTLDGLPVTSLARTAIDVSRRTDFEAGLVVCDSALSTGAISSAQLRDVFDRCARWPGAMGLARILEFADGRACSVGESRLRAYCARHGLGSPVPQVFIYDEDGQLLGVVDLLFIEQQTIGEFDGRAKYGIDGKDPRDQVIREKLREDAMRRLGYEFERSIWAELYRGGEIATRFQRAFARAEPRPRPRGFLRLSVVGRNGVRPTGPFHTYADICALVASTDAEAVQGNSASVTATG